MTWYSHLFKNIPHFVVIHIVNVINIHNFHLKSAYGSFYVLGTVLNVLLLCLLACSVVSDSAIGWTVAHRPPLSMEFSRQEC